MDISRIKVIAFDVNRTVADFASVPDEEVRTYIDHIRKPEWSPFIPPESWTKLPAHSDSCEGISRLRRKFVVVALSNNPLWCTVSISVKNRLYWDAIIPLECFQVFKPNPEAYLAACRLLWVRPENVLMVSANKGFERAEDVGMQLQLIRDDKVPDINALADLLGC